MENTIEGPPPSSTPAKQEVGPEENEIKPETEREEKEKEESKIKTLGLFRAPPGLSLPRRETVYVAKKSPSSSGTPARPEQGTLMTATVAAIPESAATPAARPAREAEPRGGERESFGEKEKERR